MVEFPEGPRNAHADRAVRFINNLTHTKGKWAGQSFNLRPWQEHRIIRPLFGTLNSDSGLRQYRTCFIMLPRKSGKSEIAAAVALYCLLGEGEIGGEIYSCAADREQASLVFNVAAQMVRNDPFLSRACRIIDSQKRIVNFRTGSFYRALSSESHTKHGYNASVVIYDEVHAAPSRELWDVMTTSMGSRSQPLVLAITTAGVDRHSLAYELFDYACKVRDGIILDPTFLPVLYSAPEDADWRDEEVWKACNPALGDFREMEEMRVRFAQAREVPSQENIVRRLYLCQWTQQDVRWLPMEKWDACGGESDQELLRGGKSLRGRECFGGLDLAATTDIAALTLVFPMEGGLYSVLPFFWIPKAAALKHEKRDRVPYSTWISQRLVEATEGEVIDYDIIRKRINDLSAQYRIRQVAVDRWNATQLITQLTGDGIEMVPYGQGYADMSAPAKALEALIVSGRLRHGNHPVLRWMASNASIEMDAAGNIKPSKRKSTQKIDGIIATVMALGRAISTVPEDEPLWMQRGGIVVI